MENSFKFEYSEEDRSTLSSNILERYPDRIPIICEPGNDSDLVIDKRKFLAPRDYKVGHFLMTLRRRIPGMKSSEALYIFANGTIPPSGQNMADLYDKMKDEDGLLYLKFAKESTFGSNLT